MKNEIAARNDAFNWNKTLNNAITAHPEVSFMLSAGDQVNYADRDMNMPVILTLRLSLLSRYPLQ
ncbi:MAG: hypothetical protein ACLTZI_05290 [[Eubacterium] siraeum]